MCLLKKRITMALSINVSSINVSPCVAQWRENTNRYEVWLYYWSRYKAWRLYKPCRNKVLRRVRGKNSASVWNVVWSWVFLKKALSRWDLGKRPFRAEWRWDCINSGYPVVSFSRYSRSILALSVSRPDDAVTYDAARLSTARKRPS